MAANNPIEAEDWTRGLRGQLLAWGVPVAGMVVAGVLDVQAALWPVALLWMGGACLANARRCGRMHCYFTGPFFLLMTVPVALHGFGAVPLGPDGWRWLGLTVVLGTAGLWYLPERLWGRYVRQRSNEQ